MSSDVDYYRILDLSPSATKDQIKAAYRKHAKAAHPDAGGSVEAMARVNEAYATLGDPARRRSYDAQTGAHAGGSSGGAHGETAGSRPTTASSSYAGASTPTHEPANAQTQAPHTHAHEQAATVDRERAAWARASAWELARTSAPAAFLLVVAARYIIGQTSDQVTQVVAALIAFIPVYCLALSIVFLMSPPVRLVFADLVRRYHTTHHERLGALGVVLAFFPLAIIWTLFFLPW